MSAALFSGVDHVGVGVGDMDEAITFYGRVGFSAAKTGGLWLPGLHDAHRLLALELVAGSLDGARGPIRAPQRRPSRFAPLIDAVPRCDSAPQAA